MSKPEYIHLRRIDKEQAAVMRNLCLKWTDKFNQMVDEDLELIKEADAMPVMVVMTTWLKIIVSAHFSQIRPEILKSNRAAAKESLLQMVVAVCDEYFAEGDQHENH